MLFFNTAGPVNRKDHYCISPLKRFDIKEMEMLFTQKKYFVLHAPRQTGKTTCMLALLDYLNKKGDYKCIYCNVEAAQAARENVFAGIRSVLSTLGSRARLQLKDNFIENSWREILKNHGEFNALESTISLFSENSDKPVIIIIDEIDSLVGDTLISVLRQLRSGYDKKPDHFPISIILCGVRDIQDYRIHSSREKEIITGGSAFNIKAKSLRLGDFIEPEVYSLLEQHTRETSQKFTSKARKCIWHLTQGQPWLVNALAYETCFEIKEGRNRSLPIDKDMVDQAKENLITRRETHLDQLADKLQEERVQRVIHPMLQGEDLNVRLDDIQYVQDLGLIRKSRKNTIIANPIYAEIIPRELTFSEQLNLEARYDQAWYILPDNSLDMNKLLSAFQEFFREHSEHWLERFQYKEAGPQLLMQAFLQRIINSGGRIEREYGLGRMRTDLLMLWPLNRAAAGKPSWTRWQGPVQKSVIELKILHKSLEKTIVHGLEQTFAYMDRCSAVDGHLVIFNRRSNLSWEEKIFKQTRSFQGKKIVVWGM
ncbi:MAG: ATP-binding protein [Thermodesulfobacteriota bacterium]|nr:ATP-binding protein [Thermodesulfobacteriota bacterium]